MTAVESVRVHRIEVPLARPFVTSVRTATALSVMLVELVDSDGRSGWGESPASWRVTGESPEGIRAVIEGPLADLVVGRDPAEFSLLSDELASAVIGNASARSGVDCAIHDLAAQAAGMPLARLLGGAASGIRTDMTLSAAATDELVADARAWAEAGFGTIKIKAGAGHDDTTALRRVRDAVGPSLRLRVDANQGWSARQAVEVITAWERFELGIELVEQPVAARSIDDLAFVTSRVSTPVLADESAWTSRDLLEIVHRRAADLVNLKLAKTGGIGEARRMLAVARATGTGVLIGSMMEGPVGIAAAASVAAAGGMVAGGGALADATHDLDAGLWLQRSPVTGGAAYRGDVIELSAAPGLGITGLAS
jgi:L-alanine-DL-glutamate epimerase-like enolase superfamily enzyme